MPFKVEIHEPRTLTSEQAEDAASGIWPSKFISLEEAKKLFGKQTKEVQLYEPKKYLPLWDE